MKKGAEMEMIIVVALGSLGAVGRYLHQIKAEGELQQGLPEDSCVNL